jgi:Fic family protein
MDIKDYNAGKFEQQFEYKSFQPEIIHHPWVIADSEILYVLSQADRSLGELNAFSQLIPNIDFFIQMHIVKEATESSRIEGTQTNIEDAFKVINDLKVEDRDDWSEVQNYIKAINFSINRLKELPLSNRLLRETHKVLMQGVRGKQKMPGAFRESQNWIGVSLKNAVFVPPHHLHVVSLMSDMEKFLNDNEIMVPPLVKIAIAHYQFETIHPFLDGNGRLGRLMITLYLASENLLAKPALYLSDYFERNKTAYIDHLMAVRQGHHMREWLIFFLHGVSETAQKSIAVFRSIISLKERIQQEILPQFSPRRQANVQKMMNYLYAHPVIDIKTLAKKIECTQNTASDLIVNMVAHNILVETTGQHRNRLFIFRDYVSLFEK